MLILALVVEDAPVQNLNVIVNILIFTSQLKNEGKRFIPLPA